MLIVSNLSFKRDDSTILANISATFEPGTITCITGASGIGKSTLLSCIAQLYPYEGTISFETTDLANLGSTENARMVGMVFQQLYLFPQLTVRDNVAQPLWVTGQLTKKQALAKAEQLLTDLGMRDYADRYCSQLSGGQQQRVALARAVALQPKVLCLDEPSSSLDEDTTRLLIEVLYKLKQKGITLIITSHDTSFVSLCADSVLELTPGHLKKAKKAC